MLASQRLFGRFPRQIGFPARRTVWTAAEMVRALNAYNGHSPVYVSLFHLEGNRKDDLHFTHWLDKAFADLDGPDAMQHTMDASKFLLSEGIRHGIVKSGGGWHIYADATGVELNNPNDALINFKNWITEGAGVPKGSLDEVVGGNVAQMVRLPGTFNVKRKVQDMCGFLFWKRWAAHEYEVDKMLGEAEPYGVDVSDIMDYPIEVERNLPEEEWWSPGDPIDLKAFDSPAKKRAAPTLAVGADVRAPVVIDLNCVKEFAKRPEANSAERYIMTTFMIERGHSLADIYDFMERHLSQRKFHHALRTESDSFRRAFDREYTLPSCDWIRDKTGFDIKRCQGCPLFK